MSSSDSTLLLRFASVTPCLSVDSTRCVASVGDLIYSGSGMVRLNNVRHKRHIIRSTTGLSIELLAA